MQTEPRIVERPARPYVAVRKSVMIPFDGVIPGIMVTLFAEVNAQALQPVGPVFFKYNFINMPDLEIDFGVPVATEASPGGELVAGVLPAGRYVELVHFGHYDELMGITGELIRWAKEKGIRWDAIETPDGDTFVSRLESYPNSPDEEPDPKKWETIIEIKIRD